MATPDTPDINEFVKNIKMLLDMYVNAESIDRKQADILTQIAEQAAGFYETTDVSDEELRAEQAKLVDVYMTSSRETYIQRVRHFLSMIPRPKIKLPNVNLEEIANDPTLAPFLYTGLISQELGANYLTTIVPFALFPLALGRPAYPDSVLSGLVRELTQVDYSKIAHFFEKGKKWLSDPNYQRVIRSIREQANQLFYSILEYFRFPIGPLHSTDIYELGLPLYRDRSVVVFTFSTTSGLVIPSEYSGGARKNPLRKQYFDEGLLSSEASKLKRFYQWDLPSTARALYQDYTNASQLGLAGQWQQEAVDILSRAFEVENLEITEAEFGPSEIGVIKQRSTIICKNAIVATQRDQELRKIEHARLIGDEYSEAVLEELLNYFGYGIDANLSWWNPHFLAETEDGGKHSVPFVLKRYLYDRDVQLVVKPMGKILSREEAVYHIKRLLQYGRDISGEDSEDSKENIGA